MPVRARSRSSMAAMALAAVATGGAQQVELGMHAGCDHAAFSSGSPAGPASDGDGDLGGQAQRWCQCARGVASMVAPAGGQARRRPAAARVVMRRGQAGRAVRHFRARRARAAAPGRAPACKSAAQLFTGNQAFAQLSDGAVACADGGRISHRPQDRCAQQPFAHRRIAAVQRMRERGFRCRCCGTAGRPVPGFVPKRNQACCRHASRSKKRRESICAPVPCVLRGLRIVQHCARGDCGGGVAGQAEAIERECAQLTLQQGHSVVQR